MSEFDMPVKQIVKRLTHDERIAAVGTDVGLTPRQANAITKARLNFAISQLAEQNIENVHEWLQRVAAVAPAEAVRLYMELMEFSVPRMKAAQVNLNANADLGDKTARSLADMSIEDLRLVAEG